MKTRDRILQASLLLFNERGERNVTTNHLSAHLGISPGNLYYHFKNKSEIVYELFREYEALVDGYLAIPEEQPLTLNELMFYLESVISGLWAYRFLHRDLEFLLESDPRLRTEYRAFTERCLEAIARILDGLAAGGVMQRQDPALRDALALNAWLVITNWMAYLKTKGFDGELEPLQERLQQVVYQVLTLQIPYLMPAYRADVEAIRQRFMPD